MKTLFIFSIGFIVIGLTIGIPGLFKRGGPGLFQAGSAALFVIAGVFMLITIVLYKISELL